MAWTGRPGIEAALVSEFHTEACWHKAVQHLTEEGLLEHSPRDIGTLLKELAIDLKAEQEDYIKGRLFKYFWPKIQRGTAAGFPEWYKQQLLESAFNKEEE